MNTSLHYDQNSGNRYPRDNPLDLLRLNYKSSYDRVISTPLGREKKALKLLIGVDPERRALGTIHKVSLSTLKEQFGHDLIEIIGKNEESKMFRQETQKTQSERPQGKLHENWENIGYNGKLTRHHIIAETRGGSDIEEKDWGTSNIILLPRYVHDALHVLLKVWTPAEQLAYFTLLYKRFYTPEFMKNMKELLTSENQRVFYRDGIISEGKLQY